MKVYLDSSCLNRIFDDQSQPRIFFESIAMGIVFILIDRKELEWISSDALKFEMEKNPFPDKREFVKAALSPAQVKSVDILEDGVTARVVVHPSQLSLAIGKSGQNARLAAKLTNMRIDIKTEDDK